MLIFLLEKFCKYFVLYAEQCKIFTKKTPRQQSHDWFLLAVHARHLSPQTITT